MMVPFFVEIPIKTRLELLKKAGFDNLMFTLDREHEKYIGKLEDVIELCRAFGIGTKVAHAGYKEPEVTQFWADNQIGQEYEKRYLADIEFAHKHGIQTVVFHLNASKDYELTQIGLKRLEKMAELGQKLGVKIAVENLYRKDELDYIFANIQNDFLGMCFDSGHENCLTPNQGYLQKYPHKLFAVHLHDNNGLEDEHNKPFTGTVDWQKVASGLAKANQVSLDGEIRIKRPIDANVDLTEHYYNELCNSYQSLLRLEQMILQQK